jgi:cytoskeletal protein RodZ
MRKILIITLSLVLLSVVFAFAATEVTNYPTLSFQASSNVKVYASSAAQTYAAISAHLNGDRIFGASSNETVIRYTSKDTGTAITASNLTKSDSSAFSGWSSL